MMLAILPATTRQTGFCRSGERGQNKHPAKNQRDQYGNAAPHGKAECSAKPQHGQARRGSHLGLDLSLPGVFARSKVKTALFSITAICGAAAPCFFRN